MKRVAAKLAFVHRRLWQRDGVYRAAVLLGPPPLIGCALAVALWGVVHALGQPSADAGRPPPWATPKPPGTPGIPGRPLLAEPMRPLAVEADGKPDGYETGWMGRIYPIEVGPGLDVNVLPTHSAEFTLDQPSLDMAGIMGAGPATGLYVGVGAAVLAIKASGVYGLTFRIERSSQDPADCMGRFTFAGHRLASVLGAGLTGTVSRGHDPVPFELRPGLYQMTAAFGCWREGRVVGPGRLTVLIRRPGDQIAQPARPDDIFRPLPKPR